MKQIKPITLLLVLLGLIIYSCSSESPELDITKTIKAKDIEFVGIEHNIMLDEAYQFLAKQHSEKDLIQKSDKTKKESLEDFLISRVKANKKYPNSVKKAGIENIQNLFREELTFSKASNSYKKKTIPNIEEKYLKKLENIIGNSDFSVDNGILNKISDLEKEIEKDNTLKNNQLLVLFSATQTAKYSFTYWKKNWKKWLELNKNEKKSLNLCKTSSKGYYAKEQCWCGGTCQVTKDLVNADVAGAVGTAVGAAAANIIVGPGTVAYGGAIVAGGVGNSAIEGAKKLLDWLW